MIRLLISSVFLTRLCTDLKASNVLIGAQYNPRVADFGLSVRGKENPEDEGEQELLTSSSPHHTPDRLRSVVELQVRTDPSHRPNKAKSRIEISSTKTEMLPSSAQKLNIRNRRQKRRSLVVQQNYVLGTWPWQAPEVLKCEPHDER